MLAPLWQSASEYHRRTRDGNVMGHRPETIVGGHEYQRDRGVPMASGGTRWIGRSATSKPEPASENREQIDVHNRHPVDAEPGPREWTERPRAVRRWKIHEHMAQDTNRSHRPQHDERGWRIRRVAVPASPPRPDECGNDQRQPDDAEWTMRRPSVKLQIVRGASRGDDDVDVGSARGEKKSRGGASAGTRERSTGERQPKQAVRQVVQDPNITR